MFCFTQMLEINECVLLHPLVKRTKIDGTKSKRICANEVVKIPVIALSRLGLHPLRRCERLELAIFGIIGTHPLVLPFERKGKQHGC